MSTARHKVSGTGSCVVATVASIIGGYSRCASSVVPWKRRINLPFSAVNGYVTLNEENNKRRAAYAPLQPFQVVFCGAIQRRGQDHLASHPHSLV